MSGLVLIIAVIILQAKKKKTSLDDLPGPKSYPLIGNLLDYAVPRESKCRYYKKWHRKNIKNLK